MWVTDWASECIDQMVWWHEGLFYNLYKFISTYNVTAKFCDDCFYFHENQDNNTSN